MTAIKGFDPSAVKREHIKPITVLFGGDVPGIALRIERFIEVLADAGEDVRVFPDGTAALGYVVSGDMFSDHVCVVIRDARDLTKSSNDAKKSMSAFIGALGAYDASSTFVIGMPGVKSTSAARDFFSGLASLGAMMREVKPPVSAQETAWAIEYAKSQGKQLSEESAAKAVAAANGDLEKAGIILDEMIYELRNLSVDEIKSWLSTAEELSAGDIKHAIMCREPRVLAQGRTTFADNVSGYRSYLVRLRFALLDMLIAAEEDSADPYATFKAAQYGREQWPGTLSRLSGDKERTAALEKAYLVLCSEIERASGASGADPSPKRALAALAAI